jgi:hypothetical protein
MIMFTHSSDDITEKERRVALTNLLPVQLEIIGAGAKDKVALQIYDENENKFRLAIKHLNNSKTDWLPLPTDRPAKFYEDMFNRKATMLGWSPNGHYLTASLPGKGFLIWDTIRQEWKRRGREIIFANVSEDANLLWLDEDRVLSFGYSLGSSLLYSGKVSEFTRSLTPIGELRGILVKRLFMVNIPESIGKK